MSTITIRKTFKLAGVAVDVTSFTLSVIRADTGAVVAAAGTAMTHAGTGLYEYAFTAPAANLTYTISYTIIYAGQTLVLPDTYTDTSTESIALPDLTGDDLVDTLNSLIIQRLQVAREGPKPSYSLHGHKVDWTQYLDYLDKRIMALRKEIAMTTPLEEVGYGF